ncbi:ribonuclease P protein component [Psychromicrobium xiongbiense]|uniref:ribonuclease P protein component n=1 Tax=Psychromicrobium xiongbiense TaxID=3051184 RepID=UPI002553F22B|nr:ribonuclease P protein component [Psychromicrobium sp. YIM S02556]
MLPAQQRMRRSAEFSTTVRSGVRSGRRNLVLYTHVSSEGAAGAQDPARFGFIVSKAVDKRAVRRNLVKRRLRAIAAELDQPRGLTVVVRALPSSVQASWAELDQDFRSAWSQSMKKLRSMPSSSQLTPSLPLTEGRDRTVEGHSDE